MIIAIDRSRSVVESNDTALNHTFIKSPFKNTKLANIYDEINNS